MEPSHRNPSKWIEEVKQITLKLVDQESFAIFLFGSRARQPNNNHGDIDVGLLGEQNVPLELLFQLQDAIEESDIPLKVDFIDFKHAEKNFKNIALQDIVIWNKPNTITVA